MIPDPAARTAIVTDSAACLPASLAAARGVLVVPLRLLAGRVSGTDGDPGLAAAIGQAVADGERPTTARPAPQRFAAAYRQAAAAGADAVVSVHVAGQLSGTAASAELAAAGAEIPVTVVDAGTIGMGLGLTVLAAAAAAAAGLGPAEVAGIARGYADLTRSFFVLDSVAPLLAGGRLAGGRLAAEHAAGEHAAGERPAGEAPAGPALIARPILQLGAGRIALLERVRTRSVAAGRLVELTAEAALAAGDRVDVAVQHTAAADRAAGLAGRLRVAVPQLANLYLTEASGAIRAHTGPGMLGISIGPHPHASGHGMLRSCLRT